MPPRHPDLKVSVFAHVVSTNVRAEMGARSLTAAELARRLNTTPDYVYRLTANKRPLNAAEIETWAKAIGCPIEALTSTARTSEVEFDLEEKNS